MSRKKVSTTIYVTTEQAERLKLLSERTKVPIAVYIREGIDLVLQHYDHVLPGQMSLDAGPSTLASRRETVREPMPSPAAAAASSRGPSRSGEGGG